MGKGYQLGIIASFFSTFITCNQQKVLVFYANLLGWFAEKKVSDNKNPCPFFERVSIKNKLVDKTFQKYYG